MPPTRAIPAGASYAPTGRPSPADLGLAGSGGDWIEKGRAICSLIEQTMAASQPTSQAIAAVERAHAALFLDGITELDIARVAHVCDRAHEAIRKIAPIELERGVHDCANVLYHQLPSRVRRRVMHEDLVRVVRELRLEGIRLRAVTYATMCLLGWIDLYRSRAEQLVQAALRDLGADGAR